MNNNHREEEKHNNKTKKTRMNDTFSNNKVYEDGRWPWGDEMGEKKTARDNQTTLVFPCFLATSSEFQKTLTIIQKHTKKNSDEWKWAENWKHKNRKTLYFLGPAFGRTNFSRIFIFEPPDFFRGFSRRIFSPHFCGKKCPEKSSRKIPGKILQNLYNKNPPTHFCRLPRTIFSLFLDGTKSKS